jgi:acetylornithine deacetylase/succinyl-diaminopimelate desuccinylase-like protein
MTRNKEQLMATVHEYAQKNFSLFLQQLLDWLSIASISTLPERNEDMIEAAKWLADNMRQAGIENVEVMATERHPVVYGDWLGAGDEAPTVLIYGHYDVQPAQKSDGWDTEPFEPIQRDGKIYARGASDDKGQAFVHVKAVESLLKSDGKLPVNVKFVVEGEEEIGSPNLPGFLRANKEKLASDICVISDGSIISEDQPAITYALRGLAALEVTIHGPESDLHSGSFGGAVHNPLQALAEILAKLHNEDGSIAVPGFYDNVLSLSDDERAELKKMSISEEQWKEKTGVSQSWGEKEFTIQERIGARPTLELNGLTGGFQGAGNKTVLPAKASAKITCRLVANQNPQRITDIVADYINKIAPPTVRVEINKSNGVHPALMDTNSTAMKMAIVAYEKGWGKAPVFMREGGSIPIVAEFQKVLGVPVILMGFGLDSNNLHGPNEHFLIDMFRKGIDTSIHFLYEAAKQNSK